MSRPLRLVIFDVDGTLVDSQGDILAAMTAAFERADHPAPGREAVLGIVGLSLDVAVPRLAPHLPADLHTRIVGWYKEAYMGLRAQSTPRSTYTDQAWVPIDSEARGHLDDSERRC